MKLSTKTTSSLCLAILFIVFVAIAFNRDTAEDMSPTTTNAAYSESMKTDPLRDVLLLVENGDTEAAVDTFLKNGDTNLIASTSLQEFKVSEAEFVSLGSFFSRHKQSPLQQKFIQRVSEIKKLVGMLQDRAIAAKSQGDMKTADAYIRSVNRLGEQLKTSNTVLIFQQTGMALESIKIP